MNKVEPELEKAEPDDVGAGINLMSLSDFPLDVSSYELIQEQQFWFAVLEVPSGTDSIGEAVFQLVVPAKFRCVVFKVALRLQEKKGCVRVH